MKHFFVIALLCAFGMAASAQLTSEKQLIGKWKTANFEPTDPDLKPMQVQMAKSMFSGVWIQFDKKHRCHWKLVGKQIVGTWKLVLGEDVPIIVIQSDYGLTRTIEVERFENDSLCFSQFDGDLTMVRSTDKQVKIAKAVDPPPVVSAFPATLARTWEAQGILNEDAPDMRNERAFMMKEGSRLLFHTNGSYDLGTGAESETGSWELEHNQTEIRFHADGTANPKRWYVISSSTSQLVLQQGLLGARWMFKPAQ